MSWKDAHQMIDEMLKIVEPGGQGQHPHQRPQVPASDSGMNFCRGFITDPKVSS